MNKKTVFSGNGNSQYDPGLIVKEVHDYFGKSIRVNDARSVVPNYYTHFRATYNGDNDPTNVKYYRGTKEYKTQITCVPAATLNSKYFAIHSAPDNQMYLVWYNVDGAGVAPVHATAIIVEITVTSSDSAALVALATELTLKMLYSDAFQPINRYSDRLEILTNGLGVVDDSIDVNTGFTIVGTQGKQELVEEITIIYTGGNPSYNGQVLKGYSFDIYSGKFVKQPEVNLGDVTVNTFTAKTPTIQNVTLTTAGTEYPIVLPVDTYKFILKVRNSAGKLQLAWAAGQSATNYITVGLGVVYSEDTLALDTNRTMYVTGNQPGMIVEVLSWE